MNKFKSVFQHSDYREKISILRKVNKKSKPKLVFVCEFYFKYLYKKIKTVESFVW